MDVGQDEYFGVDVGGTKILGVAADHRTGAILDAERIATPVGDSARLAEAIGAVVRALIDRRGRPRAVGVGVPGLVDRSGILRYGPNVPGVIDLDAAGYLGDAFALDAVTSSDANNAALAELRWGAAQGVSDAVVITQGTGIGGAIIVNGAILRGANGFAGEPGHMLIERNGHRCACGQRGCWEAYASGAGLVNIARAVIDEGGGAALLARADGVVDHLRGEHIADAARCGDPDGLMVLERFADWVARGLANLINLLDPERVVLGGGLASIGDLFLDAVADGLGQYVLGGSIHPPVDLVTARCGPEAGAIGAVALAADAYPTRG